MRKLFAILIATLIIAIRMGATPSAQAGAWTPDTLASDTTLLSLTRQQADSIMFRLTHHYSENFNFIVCADSLVLLPREGDLISDTCVVRGDDIIAVAAIKITDIESPDSVWVKVARDQWTMGWIAESDLLRGAVPHDPISQTLAVLTDTRAVWMTAVLVLAAAIILIRRRRGTHALGVIRHLASLPLGCDHDMDSIYPALFVILTSVMAALYATVQNFVPEFWQEYYFHPTLNPLTLPPLMAALVTALWLVVICFIATIDEVYHHFYFMPGVTYLIKLAGTGILAYLVTYWGCSLLVGYLTPPVLTFLFFRRQR